MTVRAHNGLSRVQGKTSGFSMQERDFQREEKEDQWQIDQKVQHY